MAPFTKSIQMRWFSRIHRRPFWGMAALALLLLNPGAWAGPKPEPHWYGACQMQVSNAPRTSAAGLKVAVFKVAWSRGEPRRGEVNKAYFQELRQQVADFRKYGIEPLIDFGFQYAPKWVEEIPGARYRNQFGETYVPEKNGAESFNAVWNPQVRQANDHWVGMVFEELGTNFRWVRLGWGYYGELNFPPSLASHPNAYWAFDDRAQGREKDLPPGIPPCPTPGWVPGTPSENHQKARLFVNWYLAAQQNWHDWQMAMVRRYFKGQLCMLYPSVGLVPGELEMAIGTDLAGTSGPERNRKVQMGHDFSRFIAGVKDPGLVVYSTWVDADHAYVDDRSTNRGLWSPMKLLGHFAEQNPLHFPLWGENTGRGNVKAMEISFERVRALNMMGLIWAFEPDLFSGKYATLEDYATLIRQNP